MDWFRCFSKGKASGFEEWVPHCVCLIISSFITHILNGTGPCYTLIWQLHLKWLSVRTSTSRFARKTGAQWTCQVLSLTNMLIIIGSTIDETPPKMLEYSTRKSFWDSFWHLNFEPWLNNAPTFLEKIQNISQYPRWCRISIINSIPSQPALLSRWFSFSPAGALEPVRQELTVLTCLRCFQLASKWIAFFASQHSWKIEASLWLRCIIRVKSG